MRISGRAENCWDERTLNATRQNAPTIRPPWPRGAQQATAAYSSSRGRLRSRVQGLDVLNLEKKRKLIMPRKRGSSGPNSGRPRAVFVRRFRSKPPNQPSLFSSTWFMPQRTRKDREFLTCKLVLLSKSLRPTGNKPLLTCSFISKRLHNWYGE